MSAELGQLGNIRANCPDCKGALSSYEWRKGGGDGYGSISVSINPRDPNWHLDFRLYRCAGCGRGGLATLRYYGGFPNSNQVELLAFYPKSSSEFNIPAAVPIGIQAEFREAEKCIAADALRAAAGMFRSVLDKTLRDNGYKVKAGTTLQQQIDMAAEDKVITESRRLRAHEDIRVLGNDVLHDDWQAIGLEAVEAARFYAQRILEDFYDDRDAVLKLLRTAKRLPEAPQP